MEAVCVMKDVRPVKVADASGKKEDSYWVSKVARMIAGTAYAQKLSAILMNLYSQPLRSRHKRCWAIRSFYPA